MNKIQLSGFQQQIATVYNRRRDNCDRGGEDKWHFKLAHRLVEYSNIQARQTILDLATGTDMVAIKTAKKVGSFNTTTL